MSTPSDRPIDPNDPSPYAPKWARSSSAAAPSSSAPATEENSAASIIAALRAESTAGKPDPGLMIGNVRVPPPLIPRTLEPTPVPDPRWLRQNLRTRSFGRRMIGPAATAATVAAAVAFF